MKIGFKNILSIFLIALLTLPLFQHVFKVFDAGKLNGDFVLAERPGYSWVTWMDGTFQSGFDRYLEDHIGFRNLFVKINNEINFGLFEKTSADGVIVGKEKILYEYDYIRAYTGGDFIGKQTITRKMNKVKFLQEYLKQNFDIDFILIFEPSKARTLPEYIPDRFLENGRSLSNYKYFVEKASEMGVKFMDWNKLFMQARDTARYALYPPYGIHWSSHTMSFITDTLIRYIENARSIDMPEFSVKNKITPDSLSPSDYDIGLTLNLLHQLPQPKMPYPFFTFYPDTTKTRPMVLTVADSYYWNIFNTRVPEHLFANEAFWYFNAKVYPDFYYHDTWTTDLDTKAEVEKQDVIILSVTERFLYKFDWGFVDQLYELYTPKTTIHFIEDIENRIRRDSQWFDDLVDEAQKENLPIEEVIRSTASDQASKEQFENYLTWFGAAYFEKAIQTDSTWNNKIIAKAQKNNVSYKEQLNNDALWTFNNDYPEIFRKYEMIKNFENQILSDSAWLTKVKEKASEYRMPLDEMVSIDAEYMTITTLENENPFERKIQVYEDLIRNNPEWLEKVTEKAEQNGVSVESMIHADAIYMARQDENEANK